MKPVGLSFYIITLCTGALAVPSTAMAQATSAGIAADATLATAAVPATAATSATKNSDVDTAATDRTQAQRELEQVREQMRDLSRRMAELSLKAGDVGPRAYAYRYIGDPDRAVIGVVSDADKQGARVSAVTPGGPAERAGIRVGDIITDIFSDSISMDKTSDGSPKNNMREVFQNLKVGEHTQINLLRDGKKIEISVTAERREAKDWARVMADAAMRGETPQLPKEFDLNIQADINRAMAESQRALADTNRVNSQYPQRSEEYAQHATEIARPSTLRLSSPLWGLHLTSLSPDLGTYFGSDKGVLIVSADKKLEPLKAGDVLLALGGKSVERPEDVMRLLRDQPSGKQIEVQVLRQHKPQTLSMQTPEFGGMFNPEYMPPIPPSPPTPPTPPTPPKPPTPPAHAGWIMS